MSQRLKKYRKAKPNAFITDVDKACRRMDVLIAKFQMTNGKVSA